MEYEVLPMPQSSDEFERILNEMCEEWGWTFIAMNDRFIVFGRPLDRSD